MLFWFSLSAAAAGGQAINLFYAAANWKRIVSLGVQARCNFAPVCTHGVIIMLIIPTAPRRVSAEQIDALVFAPRCGRVLFACSL